MGLIFYADISDAQVIMRLVKLFSNVTEHFLIIFKEEGIRIQPEYLQQSSQLAAKIDIDKKMLQSYFVDPELFNQKRYKCHVIRLNITSFISQVGGTLKKEGIRLYQDSSEPKKIQSDTYSDSGPSRGSISSETIDEYRPIDLSGGFSRDVENPNFRIPISFITTAAKKMRRLKSNKTKIVARGNQFIIQAINNSKKIERSVVWEDIDPKKYCYDGYTPPRTETKEDSSDDEDDDSDGEGSVVETKSTCVSDKVIQVSKSTMNIFMSFNNSSTYNGIFLVYIDDHNPILRIFTPFGFYGILELYIIPEANVSHKD